MLIKFKEISLESQRLLITPMALADAAFVLELFNSKGWLEFIGDRNIHNIKAAEQFIDGAIENCNACLWTIYMKEKPSKPIGIITFIKREYLLYPDIGYALLPPAMGKGFAFEAVYEIIQTIKAHLIFEKLNAISLANNISSLKLLEKLNFKFEKEVIEKNEILNLYVLSIQAKEGNV